MDEVKLNHKTLIIEKIVINEVPTLLPEQQGKQKEYIQDKNEKFIFRPYLQIFKGNKAIYNYLADETPKEYKHNDKNITFEVGVEVTDDTLIRCRHFENNEDRVSVFRIMFHPSLAFDEIYRFNRKDVDFSPNIETTPGFEVDVYLRQTKNENTDTLSLEKARLDTIKVAEQFRKNRQADKKSGDKQA